MPESLTPTPGSPCWADLWTSDVEGARRFYGSLFGWEPTDPDPAFGGYFNFTRAGAPIAGAMGDMGDQKASDTWKMYLATPHAAATVERAAAAGATVVFPAMAVADLGVQAVMTDPAGAAFGVWEPGTHRGFSALNVPDAPSWFELHTTDHDGAVEFYCAVFELEAARSESALPFTYTVLRDAAGIDRAGVMDATGNLPAGVGPHWLVYWQVDDAAAAVARVRALGGTVIHGPDATPFGQLAAVADPSGARLQLHEPGR